MDLSSNLFIVVLVGLLTNVYGQPETQTDFDPDYGKSIVELIESRGFKYETHYVVTEDSYILGVYRLINPFVKPEDRPKMKPIILQHGFMGSAVDFLINAPGGDAVPCRLSDAFTLANLNETITNNLGYLLANLCYDVWLSNSRGNLYSRNHTTYDPDKDPVYWQFSFDEMIKYDTPAIINHVLETTGFESLGFVGHSQGTLVMFGLLAEQPEYSLKVKPFIALAPVVYTDHIILPLRIASSVPGLLWSMRQIGGELNQDNFFLKMTEQISCGRWEPKVCEKLIYPLMGYNVKLLNESRVDVYRSEGYGGSSVWNLAHWGQNSISGDFTKFDYGTRENYKLYGGPKPPKYPLTQINSTQIAIIYAKSDTLGDYMDVTRLIETLKVPLMRDYFIPEPSWNHLDFIYAETIYSYVHKEILNILQSSY